MTQFKDKTLTVLQSALFATTSSVVETDDLTLLVDPACLPGEVAQLREYTESRGKELYLLFTHSDWDHIIGSGAFPKAQTIGSRELSQRPDKDSVLDQIREFDDKYYLIRDYAIRYPEIDIEVLSDQQKLVVNNTELTFYKAPGHTKDGLFCVVEPAGILLVGDYLSDLEFPFLEDSHAYEETLAKLDGILERHKISLGVPGHGKVMLGKGEIRKRQQRSLGYIDTLRSSVAGSLDASEILLKGYQFPRTLLNYHRENELVIKRELEEQK